MEGGDSMEKKKRGGSSRINEGEGRYLDLKWKKKI